MGSKRTLRRRRQRLQAKIRRWHVPRDPGILGAILRHYYLPDIVKQLSDTDHFYKILNQ